MWPFNNRLSKELLDAEVEWSIMRRYRSTLVVSEMYQEKPLVSFCLIVLPQQPEALEVLKRNLKAIEIDKGETEFIALIPQDQDMEEWRPVRDANHCLKLFTYSPETDPRKLRNLASALASGKVFFTLTWADILPPRATNYVFAEMTKDLFERIFAFEKIWRRIYRMTIWRETFYELGGFDENVSFKNQCHDLIHRAKNYGILLEHVSYEEFNKTMGIRRSFVFWTKKSSRHKHSMELDKDLITPFQ